MWIFRSHSSFSIPLDFEITRLTCRSFQNYQAEDSCEEEPVEPASKRSKVRGRVTSKGRSKLRVPVAESSDSSTDSDDVPLSQVSGKTTGKGKPAKKAQKKKAPPAKKKHSKPPTKKASKPVKVFESFSRYS